MWMYVRKVFLRLCCEYSFFMFCKKAFLILQELQKQTDLILPVIDEVQNCTEAMKGAIYPADIRILMQRIWSLTQKHTELIEKLNRAKAFAQQRKDKIPEFDAKYVVFILPFIIDSSVPIFQTPTKIKMQLA